MFYRLALLATIGLAFTLHLRLLDRFPLREDEALYSFWALHFWPDDPFFLTVWPDKPPLFLWLLAGTFQGWGAGPASGRLLNSMVTLLTALVIGATARRLWGCRLWGQCSGFVATLFYLLNPFVLSFAPTVYTDPLLVLAGQLAILSALTGRGFGAGFWLAITVMTKQQGVLYAPLILLLLWDSEDASLGNQPAHRGVRWLPFLIGATLVLAPLVYWDSTRWAVAPSPWDLGVRNYGALQFIDPSAWWGRTVEWAKLMWYFTASWPIWLGLGSMMVVAVLQSLKNDPGRLHQRRVGWWLALWTFGFLVLHITTSVQIWDRYLLPVAPFFGLGVAWTLARLQQWSMSKAWSTWAIAATLVALLGLLSPALAASTGALPIGGDHGAYSGLPEAIAWLKTHTGDSAILYHQRLGWHYRFYLYDQIRAGDYELRWFPNTTYLAADAAKSPTQRHFFIQPDWAPQADLALRLSVHQIKLVREARFGQMTLFTIQHKPQPPCDWCSCRLATPWAKVWDYMLVGGSSSVRGTDQ